MYDVNFHNYQLFRLSWPQTGLTFSTLHFSDPEESTEKLSSPLQVRMPGNLLILLRQRVSITLNSSRLDILKIHSRRMNLTRGINLRKIAEQMGGSSGAEVKGTCTEAGMYALRERRVHVTQEDFEMAVAKIMQKDSEKNMSIKKLFK